MSIKDGFLHVRYKAANGREYSFGASVRNLKSVVTIDMAEGLHETAMRAFELAEERDND